MLLLLMLVLLRQMPLLQLMLLLLLLLKVLLIYKRHRLLELSFVKLFQVMMTMKLMPEDGS